MTKRKPILTVEEFIAAHEERQKTLKNYCVSKRGLKIHPQRVEKILERSANRLFAANSRARIAFALAIMRCMKRSLKDNPERIFAFVTFAPRDWVMPLSWANGFKHMEMRNRATALLDGFSYIGAIDLALYSNVSVMFNGRDATVAPHIHALTWGHRENEIAQLAERVNQSTPALLRGMPPFHYHILSADDALARVNYMLKAPLSEYRAIAKEGAEIDPVTRRIIPGTKGSFDQKKRALRPGALWKMTSVLGNRTIPDIMFAGEEGVALLESSIAYAVQRIRENDTGQREMKIRRRLPATDKKPGRTTN